MNEIEIDVMNKMLTMDPYSRITARQAIEHTYFDSMRAKDPEYCDMSDSSVEASDQSSTKHRLLDSDGRVVSPD